MSRLQNIRPQLGALAPRLGYMPGDEGARDKARTSSQAWRAWYKSARWERLRREVFARDHYRCQRSGELCSGRGNDPFAPVANHMRPHRGDPALFWDADNIETVTKRVHDGLIQREEKREATLRP